MKPTTREGYLAYQKVMVEGGSCWSKERKEIIETIEMHDQGLADTLPITADPELQTILKESEKEIESGKLIPLDEV